MFKRGRQVIVLIIRDVEDKLNFVREQALRNAVLAWEAEQRKNDLIVYLAHDLKIPLTSVIGYLTLLHDEPQISEMLRARIRGLRWIRKAYCESDVLYLIFQWIYGTLW